MALNVRVEPLITGTLDVNASDRTKVPADDASQNDTWLIVSVVVME
jgi:hypothetical protein